MSLHDPRLAPPAPPLQVDRWLNAPAAWAPGHDALAALRGQVVLLHAFQMLCPGCVTHALPQAQRMQSAFGDALAVVGLHTVFEHHAQTGPAALAAFVHEFGWTFPIGIDRAAQDGPVPLTMQAYGLRGTPSLILIDRAGRMRLHHFGALDDLRLGVAVGRLLAEASPAAAVADPAEGAQEEPSGCTSGRCALPAG